MKTIAFDLEIARPIPDGTEDRKECLGISCAATYTDDGVSTVWVGEGGSDGWPERLSAAECCRLANYLVTEWVDGALIVTWNGLGFDFYILAEECAGSGWHDNLADLALDHVDVAFAMFCDLGYMCGLDAACQGMRIPGKMEGMCGALAPVMWAQGPEAQERVMEYVAQDAKATLDIYLEIVGAGFLRWITKRGVPCRTPWYPVQEDVNPRRLLTVEESLRLPAPNVSWMDDPWPRSKFYGWTGWTP